MKHFDKIAIVGVGLIGGSIGVAIKTRRLAKEVIGIFRHKSTLRKALKKKAVDEGVMDLRSGVKDADLIIIASPVYSIPYLTAEAVRFAKRGAIITDVGSTKKWIVDKVEKLIGHRQSVSFVGSHPMAGSEQTGVESAKSDLLEGSPCIVTKTKKTNAQALKRITDFWKSLGAKVEVMDPLTHDKRVSFISHLPHVVAFSIAGAVPEEDIVYAAEGFKDTTRVASSDPALWADIFLTNKKEILKAGRIFENYYKTVMRALSRGDYSKTVELLKKAKAKRDKFFQPFRPSKYKI